VTRDYTGPPPHLPAPPPAPPRPLGDALRTLGPVHLRLGHYLALRADVLEERDRQALMDYGDHVAPLPWPIAHDALATALGAPFTELFARVEPDPVRSNGIAQVHRARLADDAPVTVKVLRPGAVDEAARAIDWLATGLAALLGRPGEELGDVVEDAAEWLSRQLDLTLEADNLDRLARLAVRSEWERVPSPHADLCTASLLVCEDLGGIAGADAGLTGGGPPHSEGLDRVRLARAIPTVVFRQAFRYRLFQTDLHPDNVIALPGDVVSFADWSSLGRLDPSLAEDQLTYLTAVFEDDTERALDPPTTMVALDQDGDVPAFRRDLLQVVRERATAGAEHADVSVPTELLATALRSGRERRVGLPEGARLLYRALIAAEDTARRIHPRVRFDDVGRRALGVARVGGKLRKLEPSAVEATLSDLARLLRDVPGQLQKILADLADGSFSMNVWVAEAAQVERNRNRRTRLLVAAIVSVSLATLLTAPDLPAAGGVSLAWPVAVVLAAVLGWLALEWRRLR
jgi:ubiquinone biosynthesis protein